MRSRASARVLGAVLSADGLHLREIARRAGVPPSGTKRELGTLESLGVLRRERKGNLCIYFLRENCPFLPELRGLYLKTEGVAVALGKALGALRGADFAFIYGSFASGAFGGKSDIDVMVIGGASEEDVGRICFEIQKKAGREVNWTLWTPGDVAEKTRAKSAFLSSLLKREKIWLVGEKNEFERLVEKARSRKG